MELGVLSGCICLGFLGLGLVKGILIRGQVTHDFPVEASLDNRGLAISVFRVYCFSGSDILLRQWRVNRCVALTFLRVVNNLPMKITFRSIRNVRTCVLNTRAKFGPGFIDSFFFFFDLSGAHPLLLRNYLWPCMARARSISAPTGHGWCRVVVQLLRDRMSPRCNASASLRAVRAPRRVL